MRPSPAGVVVVCGLAGFLVQLLAGWPGWLAPESIPLLTQATAGAPADAASPVLTWLWGLMGPSEHGPLIPFIWQLMVFWTGITFLALGLQPGARWTQFLPLVMLVNPLIWVVVQVSRDSAVLCLLTLAVGVASLAARSFRRGDRTGGTVALFYLACVAGFSIVGRASMLPLVEGLVIVIGLFVVGDALRGRARFEATAKAAGLTFVAGLVAVISLPMMVLGTVGGGRAAESVYALDAFHIDCADFWATGTATAEPVSPPGLWQKGAAPCADGSPGDYGSAWTGSFEPSAAAVLGASDWLAMLAEHPALVVGGRVQHAAGVLLSDYDGAPDPAGQQLVAAAGGAGVGQSVGMPNRGGVLLSVHAAITSFLPQQLFIWILLVPIAAGVWLRRRAAGRPGKRALAPGRLMWLVLIWPALWAVAMAGLVPGSGTGAVAPAGLLAWAIVLWLLGLDGTPAAAGRAPVLRRSAGSATLRPYAPGPQPQRAGKQRRRLTMPRARVPGRVRVHLRLPRLPVPRRRHSPPAPLDNDAPLSAFLAEYGSQPVADPARERAGLD